MIVEIISFAFVEMGLPAHEVLIRIFHANPLSSNIHYSATKDGFEYRQ